MKFILITLGGDILLSLYSIPLSNIITTPLIHGTNPYFPEEIMFEGSRSRIDTLSGNQSSTGDFKSYLGYEIYLK